MSAAAFGLVLLFAAFVIFWLAFTAGVEIGRYWD